MTSSAARPAQPRPRRLADLLPLLTDVTQVGATVLGPAADTAITGVTLDSRAVRPGDLYAALPGSRVHGARFVGAAAAAGALAVYTDPAGAAAAHAAELPAIVVPDPRAQLGTVACWAYGDPTAHLRLLGITGTNGKTTVAYLVEAGLRAEGRTTGLLGTVETRVAGQAFPSVRTTPEAPDLQALFAAMLEHGVDAAAMEVSSHSLALHRVDGARFAGAAFTNLSQDHLDFHEDMESYFAAKASLFTAERTDAAVIGVDDPWGRRLADTRPAAVTYAVHSPADWRAEEVALGPAGTTFRLRGPGVDLPARVRLPGEFNVANALGAIALLVTTGTPVGAAVEGVGGLTGVPGRMERIDAGQSFLALVDYAHTPDAVSTLLRTVRGLVAGRVIVVLGCGGDRDRGKRPLMGAAAAAGADVAVLTNDNPRSEDPALILAAMQDGVREVPAGDRAEVVVEPDRAAAIALAVGRARPGDAVVVAGKGHETGQEQDGVLTPFDDRVVLRSALAGDRSRA